MQVCFKPDLLLSDGVILSLARMVVLHYSVPPLSYPHYITQDFPGAVSHFSPDSHPSQIFLNVSARGWGKKGKSKNVQHMPVLQV